MATKGADLRRARLAMAGRLLLPFLFLAGAAAAQQPLALDPSCTVTVGNQTAAVRPDGKFIVDNIAVFQVQQTGQGFPALYRVRATCLRNGEMITGKSAFFEAQPGQTTFVTDVFPTAVDPIPVSIQATADADSLVPGESTQLHVLANYADGSNRDVTPPAEGTTYISTNPNLVTVSADGVVTSVNETGSRQEALVGILNEGNTTLVFVTVFASATDFDGDGMPNDYEDLFGFDKFNGFDASQDPDDDGLTNLQEFQKGTLPNNPDTDLDGILDGIDDDPLHPEEAPPTASIVSPANGATLVEGSTIVFAADAHDDGRIAGVTLSVNGLSLGTLTARPFSLPFTVPFQAGSLTFAVTATDGAGHVTQAAPVVVSVAADQGTRVIGKLVDNVGQPVAGANVALRQHGLKAEFFDFSTPLSALPDLTGLTPGTVKFVSALNFRNPGGVLSPDTFGTGYSPDYAARFRGMLHTTGGGYRITLGADDGARLTLAGTPVLSVVPTGSYHESTVDLSLFAGDYPLVVEYFQAVADAELRLAFEGVNTGGISDLIARPGVRRGRGVAPPSQPGAPVEIRPDPNDFTGQTGPDGSFAFPGVPANLDLQADFTATQGGLARALSSSSATAVNGGTTDLGTTALATKCVTGTLLYRNCLSGPVTHAVALLGLDGSGQSLSLGTVTPDGSGHFCAALPIEVPYYFIREENATRQGRTAPCQTQISPRPQSADAACGGDESQCTNLGNVDFTCSFFGGS